MRSIIFLTLTVACFTSKGQITNWTETDRKYLLDNLARSRDLLIKEVENLSEQQWRFKEAPDRWSINEVVEHIALWEILTEHEISRALAAGPKPEKVPKPDSATVNFIMQTKNHYALEYTLPYTYAIPMGLNEGKNNMSWLLKMRGESIKYVGETKENLGLYFGSYGTVHQNYILIFGHTDRHLRQIRKIKQNPGYPKK